MNRTQHQKAFTLIELLVVISIIALLVSILMPALNKARDQAKKTTCSANLRSLTMAAIYYSDENDSNSPCSSSTWNNSGTTRAGWCGAIHDASGTVLTTNEQIYGNSTDHFTGLQKGQLWKYIENTEGWRCPADPDKLQLRSYCMSGQWWGTHSQPDKSVWYDTATKGKVVKKIDSIKTPSERFLFIDQLGINLDAYFAIWYSRPQWWNIPNFKHSRGTVNSYADGHVEGYKLETETYKAAKEALENAAGAGTSYKMPQVDMPSDDLRHYQRAVWGKTGW